MDTIIEILKEINIAQLLAIFALGWFFYNRLKKEFKEDIANLRSELKEDIANLRSELKEDIANLRSELKEDIANLRSDLKDLSIKVDDVDKRLCKIEGSLQVHGHCLFNQSQLERKAE